MYNIMYMYIQYTYQCILYSQQEECFNLLEAPIQRVCGWDTPFPLLDYGSHQLTNQIASYAVSNFVRYLLRGI